MRLRALPSLFAVCRLEPGSELPAWAMAGSFYSVTKTSDELSIVCDQSLVPSGTKAETGWRGFRVTGTLDFSLTGILSSIAGPLANARISLFALSSYDTDFVLIKGTDWENGVRVLRAAGFEFEESPSGF